MDDKLFIIDGHALIFKMYYAFAVKPIYSSKGENTSILYGFTKYLFENIIGPHKPTHLAVCFDPPAKTFRHEMYPEYKANRRETPAEVRAALEPLTHICAALNIPVLMLPGYEADDVVCTIAKREESKMDVYMVTPDKDYAQAVTDHIFMYRPGKGGTDDEILGVKEVCEKYGVDEPLHVIDYLAICGDTADNVKGVDGIGEKGAKTLLGKFGTLEGIYENIDSLTPSQKAKFEAARDHIELSKELVTIKLDTPIEYDEESLRYTGEHKPEAAELFSRYEFNSLRRHLNVSENAAQEEGPAAPEYTLKSLSYTEFEMKIATLHNASRAVALTISGATNFLALKDGSTIYTTSTTRCNLLTNPTVVKIGHNFKEIYKHRCVEGHVEDLEVIHYLLASELPHDLEYLSSQYLHKTLTGSVVEQEEEPEVLSLFDDAALFGDEPVEETPEINYEEVTADILQIHECLNLDASLRKLYEDIEEPLIKVLADMESAGVRIDIDSLQQYIEDLRLKEMYHENNVRIMAGDSHLNVASPKQIGELIFEKMQLDPTVKPHKGRRQAYSTDEETLSALREVHPIIDEILEYRGVKKLLSTYIEPLPRYMEGGKIHSTFNQCTTATGRLSSSNPNLQNIPVRTPLGSQIRGAFVPSNPAGFIMSADYSQIELRILAHLCGDKALTEAFITGVDVHAATAAKIFRCPIEEVTPEQRRIAKTANFGILYGISAFGLASRLKISRKRAAQIIEDYFASFDTVRGYIDAQLTQAREKGYVETIFSRKRYLPQISASNRNVREFAERAAINSPIQGASADIIKLAMIRIAHEISTRGLKSRMTLQIHDELLFDVAPGEENLLKKIVVKCMEGVVKLNVPLKVECNYGKSWLEVH